MDYGSKDVLCKQLLVRYAKDIRDATFHVPSSIFRSSKDLPSKTSAEESDVVRHTYRGASAASTDTFNANQYTHYE